MIYCQFPSAVLPQSLCSSKEEWEGRAFNHLSVYSRLVFGESFCMSEGLGSAPVIALLIVPRMMTHRSCWFVLQRIQQVAKPQRRQGLALLVLHSERPLRICELMLLSLFTLSYRSSRPERLIIAPEQHQSLGNEIYVVFGWQIRRMMFPSTEVSRCASPFLLLRLHLSFFEKTHRHLK